MADIEERKKEIREKVLPIANDKRKDDKYEFEIVEERQTIGKKIGLRDAEKIYIALVDQETGDLVVDDKILANLRGDPIDEIHNAVYNESLRYDYDVTPGSQFVVVKLNPLIPTDN